MSHDGFSNSMRGIFSSNTSSSHSASHNQYRSIVRSNAAAQYALLSYCFQICRLSNIFLTYKCTKNVGLRWSNVSTVFVFALYPVICISFVATPSDKLRQTTEMFASNVMIWVVSTVAYTNNFFGGFMYQSESQAHFTRTHALLSILFLSTFFSQIENCFDIE